MLPNQKMSEVAQWQRICLPTRRHRFDPWVRKIPWSRKWHPTPVFLLGKFYEQRSLVGFMRPPRVRHNWAGEYIHTTQVGHGRTCLFIHHQLGRAGFLKHGSVFREQVSQKIGRGSDQRREQCFFSVTPIKSTRGSIQGSRHRCHLLREILYINIVLIL